jgi:hypothetical protein
VRPSGTASEPRPPRAAAGGSVAIRVQPADAEILIDGARWTGGSDDGLVVQLSPGSHQIEVRKDGYRTLMTTVDVRPGETAPLNISLGRQP